MPNDPSLFTIFVPLADNEGVAFSDAPLEDAFGRIAGIAGGYTALPVSRGFWVDSDGRTWVDEIIPVQVVASGIHALDNVGECAAWLAEHVGQLEVFFYRLPCSVRVDMAVDGNDVVALVG